ncbi:DUF7544 domain-containing protein [Halobaculum litoreum]|uniref:DUF7544 domain-containing protein n=1 Tax=Halobaculum litoreum TaxID=3031998 RepID=UPI0024C3F113|nr:hypothetical protein [Halobaculum sp. DT92]
MSWHGVDAVDDAIDVTRGFLFPVRLGRWARMALVSVFAGGGGGGGRIAGNAASTAARLVGSGGVPSGAGAAAALATLLALPTLGLVPTPGDAAASVPPLQSDLLPGAVGAVGLLAVGLAALVGLALLLVTPAFQFVLVDGIARDDLRIRRDVRSHFVNGLRLLGFQIGLFAAFAVPPAAAAALAVLSGVDGAALANRPGAIVAIVLVAAAYVLLFAFLARFTIEFVVPAMVADGGGVIDGWRRVWPVLKRQPKQTVVYLVMHVLVGIGVSIVSTVLTLTGLLVVALLAGVVGLLVSVVPGGTSEVVGAVPLAAVVAFAIGIPLFVVGVAFPVGVLALTYRRAYELAALGRFADGLDLLGRYRAGDGSDDDDVAAALREADGDAAPEDGTGDEDPAEFGGFVRSSVRDPDDDPDGDDSDDRDPDRRGDGR